MKLLLFSMVESDSDNLLTWLEWFDVKIYQNKCNINLDILKLVQNI